MPTWLPGVLVALVGVIPAVLVYQQADAARKQAAIKDQRTASREDLDSARQFWRESFDAANKRIGQLEGELDTERAETRRLRRRVDRLETILAVPAVREVLEKMGLRVPNGSGEPS